MTESLRQYREQLAQEGKTLVYVLPEVKAMALQLGCRRGGLERRLAPYVQYLDEKIAKMLGRIGERYKRVYAEENIKIIFNELAAQGRISKLWDYNLKSLDELLHQPKPEQSPRRSVCKKEYQSIFRYAGYRVEKKRIEEE